MLVTCGAVAALCVVVAAVVLAGRGSQGGGGQTPDPGTRGPSVSTASSARASSQDTATAATAGRRTEDGFSWVPPAGWNRTQQSPSDVTYTSKDGAVELSAKQGRTTEDLLTHWQRFEEGFHGTPGYRKIRLERTTYAGDPAVIWEYAFLQGGQPRHGRQLGFESGGRTFQVSVWYADPAETTALRVYESVKESFRTG